MFTPAAKAAFAGLKAFILEHIPPRELDAQALSLVGLQGAELGEALAAMRRDIESGMLRVPALRPEQAIAVSYTKSRGSQLVARGVIARSCAS